MESPLQMQPESEKQQLPQPRFSSKYFFRAVEGESACMRQTVPLQMQVPLMRQKEAVESTLSRGEQTVVLQPGFFAGMRTLSYATKERFRALVQTLVSLFSRQRVDPQGKAALSQLKCLASLCLASTQLSDEEAIMFETAFGEAYYSISQHSRAAAGGKKQGGKMGDCLRYYAPFKGMLRSLEGTD
ncbi:hypothetical protein J4441_02695 [Candidatus Micrarchaeota archaeon]|nr:hypothetical protein [Candidatus Micrarchaeota archaeon]